MRKKSTNFLQLVVLITGIVYIFIGIIFYFSPTGFGWILSIDVHDDWLKEIPSDQFLSMLYYFSRAISALLFSTGLSMVLPLFDPLKYRGLIYFTGVVYPLMASLVFLVNGFSMNHKALTLFGIVFFILFLLTIIGLAITKKQADSGIE